MDAHNYYTHGIGSPPPEASKRSSGFRPSAKFAGFSSAGSKANRSVKSANVYCGVCHESVRESRLESHMRMVHPNVRVEDAPPIAPETNSSNEGWRLDVSEPTQPDRTQSSKAFRSEVESMSDFSVDVLAAFYHLIPETDLIEWMVLLSQAAEYLGLRKLKPPSRKQMNRILRGEISAGRLETDWIRIWKPRRR